MILILHVTKSILFIHTTTKSLGRINHFVGPRKFIEFFHVRIERNQRISVTTHTIAWFNVRCGQHNRYNKCWHTGTVGSVSVLILDIFCFILQEYQFAWPMAMYAIWHEYLWYITCPLNFFIQRAPSNQVHGMCARKRESALRSQIARSHMLFLSLFTWFAPFMLYIACQNGWLGMCIFAFICRWLYRWFVGKWDTKAEIDRHFIVSHISMAYRCRKRPPVVFFMFPR